MQGLSLNADVSGRASCYDRNSRVVYNEEREEFEIRSTLGMEKEMATKVAGILGKKVGMAQLFDSKGDVRPVTVPVNSASLGAKSPIAP